MSRPSQVPVRVLSHAPRAWVLVVAALALLLLPGPEPQATNLWLSFTLETNQSLRLEFESLTSDYHLVSYTDSLTNAWGLTSLLMGADGGQVQSVVVDGVSANIASTRFSYALCRSLKSVDA